MENNKISLGESEYKFAEIIWENEPVNSGELVVLANETLDWKKSTTYTVLKKLCDKGIFSNENSTVTSIIKQAEIQKSSSQQLITQRFKGSLPQFIASFMGDKKITDTEAQELKRLIDSYKEG